MIIDLPRFLAHEAHKYIFYGWIRNFRMNNPKMSLDEAIKNFMKYHSAHNEILSHKNFNYDSARVMYYNIDAQFDLMYLTRKKNIQK